VDHDARFLSREEGYLACRVACLRAGIDVAVEDLTKGLVETHLRASLEAVVLKVLDDLTKVCAEKPPLVGPQPVGRPLQSLCKHCDRRTGSRTALLCRECKKTLRSST
jgi:hypothetical protein